MVCVLSHSVDSSQQSIGMNSRIQPGCKLISQNLYHIIDPCSSSVTERLSPRGTNWSLETMKAVPAAKRRCIANPDRTGTNFSNSE